MNFFEAQDQARRTSRWLVVMYFVATALIVAGVTLIVGVALYNFAPGYGTGGDFELFVAQSRGFLIATALGATTLIIGASLYKTGMLSSGGGRVATAMGGTLVAADTNDPLRRRLRNVVEEMAIASGVPVPEIYVLEQEAGINAFAAGFAPGDAAVAVTRGTLELLDRDELQGVIAHEFSHILNGDMRLNIRLMGVLFGIMVLGLLGRLILRGSYHGGAISRGRDRNAPVVMIIGLGLTILGGIGVLFARIIKAGVSRQREYLADASAVQFTRQTSGIAGALKKIGGYAPRSYFAAADPEEVSHMLFGSGARLSGLFATHPPLTQRIQALEPGFRDNDYPSVDPTSSQASAAAGEAQGLASGFATSTAGTAAASATAISESVGRPSSQHVDYAERLRAALPSRLYDAAHSRELSFLLVIALILDRDGRAIDKQFRLVEDRMGTERTELIRQYYDELKTTDIVFRLPLLEVAFPALKQRPEPHLTYLLDLLSRLIEADGEIDLHEYCFYRLMTVNIGQSLAPARGRRAPRVPRRELRQAAIDLLAVLADQGHDDDAARRRAFEAGKALLGSWAESVDFEPKSGDGVTTRVIDHSLDILLRLTAKSRLRLVAAVAAVAADDGRLTIAEAELIRIVCATLDCPLPPLLLPDADGRPAGPADS
ncbi:MAG: M48 family metallopeptidase [Pseudomonadota bacterium]